MTHEQSAQDEHFMGVALQLAEEAEAQDERPEGHPEHEEGLAERVGDVGQNVHGS